MNPSVPRSTSGHHGLRLTERGKNALACLIIAASFGVFLTCLQIGLAK